MSIFGNNQAAAGLTLEQLQGESTNAAELAAALAGVSGIVSGQVIDYIGNTTPAGFEDVDAHPVTNTGAAKWALRGSPSGGSAGIITTTFCPVGNRLFALMWNGATDSTGANIRAAVTLDENDLDTWTLRSREPVLGAGVNAITASAIDSDRVLVVISSTNFNYCLAHIYTISTDTWTWVADFTSAGTCAALSSVSLSGGKVLVVGYSGIAKVYDPATNTWTATGAMSKPAGYLTKLSDGRVLLSGAKYDLASTTAALYTPATNTWASIAALPVGLKLTAGISLSDGRVAVSGNNVANAFYVYNPATNTWATNTFNFNKGAALNNVAAIAYLANGRAICTWGQWNGAQGGFGSTDLTWTGWHLLEMFSPDVARFSAEIRKIRKAA